MTEEIKLICLVALFVAVASQTNDPLIDFPTYSCPTGFYFSNIVLRCIELTSGYSNVDGILLCNNVTREERNKDPPNPSIDFTCTGCPNNNIPSFFGNSCVECPPQSCTCPDNNIVVDVSLDGSLLNRFQCKECQSGYQPGEFDRNGRARRCVKCANEDCFCKEVAAGYCFPEGFTFSNVEERVKFKNDDNFKSTLLDYYLKGVTELCQRNLKNYKSDGDLINNNRTACQILSNLCSLTMNEYPSAETRDDGPCDKMSSIMEAFNNVNQNFGTQHSRPGWFEHLPWTFYDVKKYSDRAFPDNEAVINEPVKQIYTFKPGLNTSSLNFQVVRYSLDGKVYELEKLRDQLSLCKKDIIFSFGTSFKTSCKMSSEALKNEETQFYDFYLQVGDKLYPVPVLITNHENNRGDVKDWHLSRRIFITDSNLGKRLDERDINTLYYIRYAKTITIDVKFRKTSDEGNINVPLVSVEYADIEYNPASSEEVTMMIEVKYEELVQNLKRDVGISVGVLSIVGLVLAVIKTVGYRRRNSIVDECSCRSFSMFLFYLCVNVSYMFFWVIVGVSWYFLYFYKGQTVASVFLPRDISSVMSALIATFVLVLLGRLHFLYKSTTYDIFFIDWEKPKIVMGNDITQKELSSVSVWRTYFMANEWNELYSIRKINPTLQYIAFVFLTDYVGLKYLTTSQPQVYINPEKVDFVAEYAIILRIGLINIVFILVWIIQRFFNFFYERYVADQLQMYVDLCSLSNVSVFVLSDTVYGHYIHGRSVHGHADVTVQELVSALSREEANLCAKRGLIPDTDQQTFEIQIPLQLRTYYDRIMQQFVTTVRNPNQQNDGDRVTLGYTHLSKLITSFIDRSLDEVDYTILDKLLLEKILDIEIRDPPVGKGILYQDNGQSFENLFCYGNEWLLFLWDVLLITSLDCLQQNFVFSALLAWFINEVLLNAVGKHFNQKNVARKSLIDERFLL